VEKAVRTQEEPERRENAFPEEDGTQNQAGAGRKGKEKQRKLEKRNEANEGEKDFAFHGKGK
jgi:hypothetical protein